MTEPLIQVLLATYNGERFLAAQIESILAQTYGSVSILCRDDGSTDKTGAILHDYAERYPTRIQLLPTDTPTKHPKRNFNLLLQASTAPYVALCDQDDLWLPFKLADELGAMQHDGDADTPTLVYSDLELIDERGKTVAPSMWRQQGIPGTRVDHYGRLLAQNVFTGCTGLLNRALVQKCLPIPEAAEMHDWWIMLVAATFGKLIPLPRPLVRYRQHSNNAVGAVVAQKRKLFPNLRNHAERKKEWDKTQANAQALLKQYDDHLSADKRELIEAYIRCGTDPKRITRVATLFRHGFLRQSPRMNAAVAWYLWDKNGAQ